MSRRDTIIIAVLVNAALLMVLFATAMRSGDEKTEKKSKAELAKTRVPEAPFPEDLFNEYVTSVPTLAEKESEEVLFSNEMAINYHSQEPIEKLVSEEVTQPHKKVESHCVNVTVKKGDFLEKIAKANNTTVAAIMKANNMNSTQLKVGQVLKVPLSEAAPIEKKVPSNVDGEFYVVREGDNPWLIASRNKINLEQLLKLNNLDDQKAKRLRPGDKLRIR